MVEVVLEMRNPIMRGFDDTRDGDTEISISRMLVTIEPACGGQGLRDSALPQVTDCDLLEGGRIRCVDAVDLNPDLPFEGRPGGDDALE